VVGWWRLTLGAQNNDLGLETARHGGGFNGRGKDYLKTPVQVVVLGLFARVMDKDAVLMNEKRR
jgi:hypothetical protein